MKKKYIKLDVNKILTEFAYLLPEELGTLVWLACKSEAEGTLGKSRDRNIPEAYAKGIEALISLEIATRNEGYIEIPFLLKQAEISQKRAENGKRGGTKTHETKQETKQEEKKPETPKKKEQAPSRIDDVVIAYNETCKELPKIKTMSAQRRTATNARLKEHGFETVQLMLKKASESDFLSGRNSRWRANFDWLMNPKNFIKVLEGNYDNRDSVAEAYCEEVQPSKWQ